MRFWRPKPALPFLVSFTRRRRVDGLVGAARCYHLAQSFTRVVLVAVLINGGRDARGQQLVVSDLKRHCGACQRAPHVPCAGRAPRCRRAGAWFRLESRLGVFIAGVEASRWWCNMKRSRRGAESGVILAINNVPLTYRVLVEHQDGGARGCGVD